MAPPAGHPVVCSLRRTFEPLREGVEECLISTTYKEEPEGQDTGQQRRQGLWLGFELMERDT